MVSLLDPSPQTHPLFSVSHPPSISSSFSNNIPLSLSTESDKQSSHTVSSSSSQKEIILEGGLKQKTFYSFQEWFNLETTGKKYRKI